MFNQIKSVKKLRKGLYYTIINCKSGLCLSMPQTNKYAKDKPEFQQQDPKNINQIWMIQEIGSNKYEIVHAVSTLVLQNIAGSNQCKLQFGRQKSSQIYYLQQSTDVDRYKYGNMHKKTSGIKVQPATSNLMQQEKMTKEPKKSESKIFRSRTTLRAGERVVEKVRIKQRQKSRKYLYCEQINKSGFSNVKSQGTNEKFYNLKFMEIDLETQSDGSLWEIRQVFDHQNQMLSQTCYIESFRSGYVLDVPQASDRKGIQITQYPCNFRFNQKWILRKVDEFNGYGYYLIKNAKSGLYLDIKGQSTKQGTPIIQWQFHESKNQIWRLQQQGKRVYLIRSALQKDLLIGIKQNSLKQQAQLVTSKMQSQCFWIIHGFVPF